MRLYALLGVLAIIGAKAYAPAPIQVTSSAFSPGGNIPAKFTCSGGNANPELHLSGVPPNAVSLAIIVDDPDAPRGLFTHWLVWNIDPKTTIISENSTPAAAAEGTNDFGKLGYGAPCPPRGTHRYFFKVFALDTRLHLKRGAKRADLDRAMRGHVIGRGELMGRYGQR
ncbi:MAG: YbhB/YbcL family Raf kinase inhibitor-like protein [Verrucomicrobia bacterium]|nr:YbhB/YbcL family Raf kinase inhibitor-like protein [Verrucomicrobiota bacterium]